MEQFNLPENEEYYVIIKGKKVYVTREVYLIIKRPGRKEAMRKYRGQRPMINGKRCKADCSECPCWDGASCELAGEISLDKLSEDGWDYADKHDTEGEAMKNLTLAMMRVELAEEDERCRDIFELLVEERTQREIAKMLDIADGTVTYYIKKIRKKLDKFRQ